MIPFVLVGIGTVAAIIYQLLALANPHYTLTLTPGQLIPGILGQLQWQARGRAERVQSLTITLCAHEEATYRVGTNTRTAKHKFFEIELIRTQDRRQIHAGDIGFGIPAETMHSFEAANNKIVWSLALQGDIARWPDTKQEHQLIIHPHPLPA